MSVLDSIFKKKKEAATPVPSSEVESGQQASIFPGIPFQADLVISPDEGLVCFVTPDSSISAYESGLNKRVWQVAVPTSRNTNCVFVGPERLLVVNSTYNKDYSVKETLFMLVDTASGQMIARKSGPHIRSRFIAADTHSGIFIGRITEEQLVVANTAKDDIEFSTHKVSYQDTGGPYLSPDQHIYFFSYGKLRRLESNDQVDVMPGRNWVHFEAPAMVYCGDGFYDRSGSSALHIHNIETGEYRSVSWGNEPVSKILPCGLGRLLIASDGGSMTRPFYSLVTLYSTLDNTKVWTLKVDDLPMYYESLLEVAPDRGWVLLQTGLGLKLVELDDGKTRMTISAKPQQWAWAKWLPSRDLLYFAGNPIKEQPGLMLCFKV